MHNFYRLTVLCALTLSLACSDAVLEENGPTLRSVSSNALVIGETVDFYFSGIDFDQDRAYRVIFEGNYRSDDGSIEPVQASQKVIEDGYLAKGNDSFSALRLSRFGPFTNPLSTSGRPGRFDGTITVLETDEYGTVSSVVESQTLALVVEPSIIIDSFRPIDSECAAPALRGMAGLAYELEVSVSGLAPIKYTYEIGRANDKPLKVIEHLYDAPVESDRVGDLEALIFNQIDTEEQFYVTSVRVIAEDAEGRTTTTVLPFSIHRPIEVVHNNKKLMAERFEPVPVSGCEPGTLGGRVSYSESKSEYRQHQVSVTVSRDWTNSQSITSSESWGDGISEGDSLSQSNGRFTDEGSSTSDDYGVTYGSEERSQMSVSTEDGVNYGWTRREGESDTAYEDRLNRLYGSASIEGTVSATAEGSVPGFAKASGTVSTTAGVEAGGATSSTEGASRTQTSERGFGTNDSNREGRKFGSTTTDRRSERLNGSYAVSTNSQTSFQDQNSRDRSRTWNFSGSLSEGTVSTEGRSESEEQTWSRSDRTDTTQSFSAELPLSKFGQFFRQTTRWVRFSEIRQYDQCGLATTVGELQFNDYTWAPDFALANSCEEIRTNHTAYTCIIPPCN
jgi:hypothetical protein